MLPSAKKLVLLSISLVAASWLASAPAHADEVSRKTHPKRVVVTQHQVRKPLRPNAVALAKLDCQPVIYVYNGKTETKTVCSPPWTAPTSSAESGPTGATSSSAVQ